MKRTSKLLSLLLATAMILSLSMMPALAVEGTTPQAPTATTTPTPKATSAPVAAPTATPAPQATSTPAAPTATPAPEASVVPQGTAAPQASSAPVAEPIAKPVYTDLADKAWYLDAVNYVVTNGIMAGVSADKFAPGEKATRGQVFLALYNMAGKPAVTAKTTFTDVTNQDYAAAAAWAESVKLTTGTGKGLFNGEASITRQELAKTFSDYMTLKNMTKLQATLSQITDAATVAEWAKEGVEYAVGAGLIQGTKGAVNPTGTSTRAELAQLLLNLSKLTAPAAVGTAPAAIEGKVASLSKYGNIALDTLSINLFAAGYKAGDMLTITVGTKTVDAPLCTNYSDVDTGSAVVRVDVNESNPYLIIAINMGDFAKTYEAKVGDSIKITLKEAGGYLSEYQAHQVTRTNERADYASDDVFANFRPIVMGKIATGVLYRTSSPVNNELGRASFADKLIETAGVKTVMNMADAKEDIDGYLAAEGFASPYYKSLYEAGQVIALNMGVDSTSAEFKASLKSGLEFMIAHEGPYVFHCTEGKDRAGFMAILLEALMGGKQDEITADYMTSYMNYYHVVKDDAQYKVIAKIADGILCQIAGLDKGSDLSKTDLKKAATDYLTGIGMTKDQVTALEKVLSTPVATEKPVETPVEKPVEKAA